MRVLDGSKSSIISIHALLAESDDTDNNFGRGNTIFLSTLSLRRATEQSASYNAYLEISIHALLAESDHTWKKINPNPKVFLSTLSLRRATAADISASREASISIHALLAESDSSSAGRLQIVYNFYPRSPCGERHTTTITICIASKFLSTLSLRRATICKCQIIPIKQISIHALLAESDRTNRNIANGKREFLSTLSLRRATFTSVVSSAGTMDFYPRSPCGERLCSSSQ